MITIDNVDSGDVLASSVRDIFAEVTRYPLEILDPHASLEEDLGIDSVKLGEVFSVLRERYQLPEKLDLPRERLKTIAGVTEALGQFLAGNSAKPSSLQGSSPSAVRISLPTMAADSARDAAGKNSELADLDRQVLAIFAEVTRYPSDILDPKASLEEELGIDSVKLGEVFSNLRERFHLPQKLEIPRDQLKTIAGVTDALRQFLIGGNGGNGTTVLGVEEKAGPGSPPPVAASAPPAEVSAGRDPLADEVLGAFAKITQCPPEIVALSARLEEDLGFSLENLRQIFAALPQRYGVPRDLEMPKQDLRTIGSVVEALKSYLARRNGAGTTTPAIMSDSRSKRHNGSGAVESGLTDSALSLASFAALKPALKPFHGKIAFISGSGRGIGKEIAVYLGALGASVIVNSFHSRPRGEETASQIKAGGGEALHLWGSMANPAHVDDIFNRIEQQHAGLDFFISSASNGMLAPLKDITTEDWEKAFRTNIIGLHQGAMRAAHLMRKRGGGKIITMSSPAAHGYVDYFGCMGAVKAAVESLTRSLAIELARDNIQVNCVSPGPVYGELLNKWPESQRLIKQWERNTAYGRLCQSDDVAQFVAYLLSDPVKLFTGSVIVMDGGISLPRM